MKKFLFILFIAFMVCSCTKQSRVRMFGGTVTINVPAGYKVTSATWKESNLFYFMETMEDDYIPQCKKFVESSSFGVLESEIIFNEKR